MIVRNFERLEVRDEALECRPYLWIKGHFESELDVLGRQLLAVVKQVPGRQMEREGIARRRDRPPLGQSGYDLALQTKIGEAVVHHALRLGPVAALEDGIESDGGFDLKDPKRPAALRLRECCPPKDTRPCADRGPGAHGGNLEKAPTSHRTCIGVAHAAPPSNLAEPPELRDVDAVREARLRRYITGSTWPDLLAGGLQSCGRFGTENRSNRRGSSPHGKYIDGWLARRFQSVPEAARKKYLLALADDDLSLVARLGFPGQLDAAFGDVEGFLGPRDPLEIGHIRGMVTHAHSDELRANRLLADVVLRHHTFGELQGRDGSRSDLHDVSHRTPPTAVFRAEPNRFAVLSRLPGRLSVRGEHAADTA